MAFRSLVFIVSLLLLPALLRSQTDQTRRDIWQPLQFHIEGFVNQYVSASISDEGKTIVFTSEGIENIPTGWRARETYRIVNADEFTEVFELAEPGKDFQIYSEGHFRRRK